MNGFLIDMTEKALRRLSENSQKCYQIQGKTHRSTK